MIPTMLLVGFVLGVLLYWRRLLPASLIIGAVFSVLWGVLVAWSEQSLTTFLGGTGLALANTLVGGVVGAAIGWCASAAVSALPDRAPRDQSP